MIILVALVTALSPAQVDDLRCAVAGQHMAQLMNKSKSSELERVLTIDMVSFYVGRLDARDPSHNWSEEVSGRAFGMGDDINNDETTTLKGCATRERKIILPAAIDLDPQQP